MLSASGLTYRNPSKRDASNIWSLVRDSGVLDPNSAYLYLLLCTDFTETCVVAEEGGRLVGFATGYRPPSRPEALFLWQIGVAAAARGTGMGRSLLGAFLSTSGARGAHRLETTIAPDNAASLALFRSVARDLDATIEQSEGFEATDFPTDGGEHLREPRYIIGPLIERRINQFKQKLTR